MNDISKVEVKTGTITCTWEEDWLVDSFLLKKLEEKRELRIAYEEEMGVDPPTAEERCKIYKIEDWAK